MLSPRFMDEVLSIRKFNVYMKIENAKKNIICEKNPHYLWPNNIQMKFILN